MIKYLPFLFFLNLFYQSSFAQLVEEDFESLPTNIAITTSTGSTYQLDNNTGSGCLSLDAWFTSENDASGTDCNNCSGNRAVISYSTSCSQDATLITNTFSAISGTINISFNYGYNDYDSFDSFVVDLYDETNNIVYQNLLSLTTNTDDAVDATYDNSINIDPNNDYSLRFRYIGDYSWGATLDDILVVEQCGPIVNFNQNCNSAINYNLEVIVSSSNGAFVNISNGSNIIESNVGTGTYLIESLTGTNTITVTNDIGCNVSELFSDNLCLCDNPYTASDDPCDAPSVDLSEDFIGSTSCSYTISGDGPDEFCGAAHNDSWLTFTAASDSVILDWTVSNCVGSTGSTSGIQFAIFDGDCNNQDAMTVLACEYSADNNENGSFIIPNLEIGGEYFIYIDGSYGSQCDYSWTPKAGIAITPPNDTCGNAKEISCGDLDTSNNILATNIDAQSSCFGLSPSNGVWYVYTGNGTDVTISTDNIATNFDTQLFLYSGSCDNLNCLDSDNNSGSGETSKIEFTAEDGVNYYIYVSGNNSSGNPNGRFGLSVICVDCEAEAGNW
tara:strand:- start:1708 stop:3378 length:1671 start_codon:yes stop_codon:yes gene_type:complete